MIKPQKILINHLMQNTTRENTIIFQSNYQDFLLTLRLNKAAKSINGGVWQIISFYSLKDDEI